MRIAAGVLCGLVLGVAGCVAWFIWYFRDTFR